MVLFLILCGKYMQSSIYCIIKYGIWAENMVLYIIGGNTMRHIRNFLYNNSDILTALAILIAAGLLIAWRMQVLMGYTG